VWARINRGGAPGVIHAERPHERPHAGALGSDGPTLLASGSGRLRARYGVRGRLFLWGLPMLSIGPMRERLAALRERVGRDEHGRLAVTIRRAELSALRRAAFQQTRAAWPVLSEVAALEFELARRNRPALTVAEFLAGER
jgi:hypothetical protein